MQNSCLIESRGKYRNGDKKYWCMSHKKLLKQADQTVPIDCGGSFIPSNLNTLDLIPEKYPGGIALWGALPAVIDTTMLDYFPGVHVHAREVAGGEKQIDHTFDSVTVTHNGKSFHITAEDAISYLIGVVFKRPLKYLTCPTCHHYHSDHDWFAVNPHKKHMCMNCGREFFDKVKAIGNPVMKLKEITNDLQLERDTTQIKRPFTMSLSELQGGIQIWASSPSIIWTSQKKEEEGIHIHTYAEDGTTRLFDDTYNPVTIENMMIDPDILRVSMAQKALPHLSNALVSLSCPNCGQSHMDVGERAFIPHKVHCCEHCDSKFESPLRKKMTIGSSMHKINIQFSLDY